MTVQSAHLEKKTFVVDEAASDNDYHIVEVDNFATVVIKRETEGIVVDIWPLHGDNPVASAHAFDSDIHDATTPADETEVSHALSGYGPQ